MPLELRGDDVAALRDEQAIFALGVGQRGPDLVVVGALRLDQDARHRNRPAIRLAAVVARHRAENLAFEILGRNPDEGPGVGERTGADVMAGAELAGVGDVEGLRHAHMDADPLPFVARKRVGQDRAAHVRGAAPGDDHAGVIPLDRSCDRRVMPGIRAVAGDRGHRDRSAGLDDLRGRHFEEAPPRIATRPRYPGFGVVRPVIAVGRVIGASFAGIEFPLGADRRLVIRGDRRLSIRDRRTPGRGACGLANDKAAENGDQSGDHDRHATSGPAAPSIVMSRRHVQYPGDGSLEVRSRRWRQSPRARSGPKDGSRPRPS